MILVPTYGVLDYVIELFLFTEFRLCVFVEIMTRGYTNNRKGVTWKKFYLKNDSDKGEQVKEVKRGRGKGRQLTSWKEN